MPEIRLRIGLVLSSVPGYSETFFYTKINGLASIGFEVVLFARGKTNPALNCKHVQPFPVFQHPLKRIICVVLVLPVVFLRAYRAVIRYCQLEKKDALSIVQIIRNLYLNAHILTKQVHWLHFGFATTALGRENVAKAIGAKMAVSLRGYDINVYPCKNPGCYVKLWKHVDRVHSISRYLLQRANELGLSQYKPFYVITPAVSVPVNPKTDFELHDPIRILTVARLTWIKGLSYGIEAIAKIKTHGLKLQYTIVGDGPEYVNLVHQITRLGLNEDVIFTGKLPHYETLLKMRDCDVYIQPSLNEGFCNAVLEAQAIGCLCIVSNVGALPENVVDNETGWLVPPRDPEYLANAILRVIRLADNEKKEFSSRARQRVTSSFQLNQHLLQWKHFYES